MSFSKSSKLHEPLQRVEFELFEKLTHTWKNLQRGSSDLIADKNWPFDAYLTPFLFFYFILFYFFDTLCFLEFALVLHFLHRCYTCTALLLVNPNWVIVSCILLGFFNGRSVCHDQVRQKFTFNLESFFCKYAIKY